MDHVKLEEIAYNIVGEALGILKDLFQEEGLDKIVGIGAAKDDTRLIDKLIEDYIVNRLKSMIIDVVIVTEEKGVIKVSDNPRYIVLIDPLDGSLNYVSKIPLASISIVFYDYRKPFINEALAGAIGNIFTSEIYSFDRDNVYVNKTPIDPPKKGFKGLISLYTEDPDFFVKIRNCIINNFNVKPKFRTLGSAALESVYAGFGRIDLFIHNTGRLRNFDVAGGIAIASRLGVYISDIYGNKLDYRVDTITNINSLLIGLYGDKLVKELN